MRPPATRDRRSVCRLIRQTPQRSRGTWNLSNPQPHWRPTMASSPIINVPKSSTEIAGILSAVTSVAVEIEKLLAASGVGGFNAPQAEQITVLFATLAQAAIKAAHDALGQEITPESVLKLMPITTPLIAPSAN